MKIFKKLFLIALLLSVIGLAIYLVEDALDKSFAGDVDMKNTNRIIFLHHSTGNAVLNGDVGYFNYKIFKKGNLVKWFNNYDKHHNTNYILEHGIFPKNEPYGWNNYPYDYYNIWVKNGGGQLYKGEPTLENLTKKYNTIIWKHCYPVSNINEDTRPPDINSQEKTLGNYKLQYNALKDKMHQFPNNKFIVWTGAVHVQKKLTPAQAQRMREFVDWVINEWDEVGDNIFIWDFYSLETEGDLYLNPEYASSPEDSHPTKTFSQSVIPLLGKRVIDIIQGNGG